MPLKFNQLCIQAVCPCNVFISYINVSTF